MSLQAPSSREVEKIRLALGVYQDGSGMLKDGDKTLPGWRDFERTVALVFSGEAQEDKSIFDVLSPANVAGERVGISCKMRREWDRIARTGRVYFELSNSAGSFWERLNSKKINTKNYTRKPEAVGHELLSLVEEWHQEVSLERGGAVNLKQSFYLTLSWSSQGVYQLFQFPLALPTGRSLKWYFPSKRCLRGDDALGTIIEWYGESGGQLKYYPLAKNAAWKSKPFGLQPIPVGQGGLVGRIKGYFPLEYKQVWS